MSPLDLGCENTSAFGSRCDWPAIHRLHAPVEPGCPAPARHHEYDNRASKALGLTPDAATIQGALA